MKSWSLCQNHIYKGSIRIVRDAQSKLAKFAPISIHGVQEREEATKWKSELPVSFFRPKFSYKGFVEVDLGCACRPLSKRFCTAALLLKGSGTGTPCFPTKAAGSGNLLPPFCFLASAIRRFLQQQGCNVSMFCADRSGCAPSKDLLPVYVEFATLCTSTRKSLQF